MLSISHFVLLLCYYYGLFCFVNVTVVCTQLTCRSQRKNISPPYCSKQRIVLIIPFCFTCHTFGLILSVISRAPCRRPRTETRNTQGMWVATRGHLQYLARKCQYLSYTDKSSLGFVEKFSVSIEMFSSKCKTTKVSEKNRSKWNF